MMRCREGPWTDAVGRVLAVGVVGKPWLRWLEFIQQATRRDSARRT